MHSISVNEAHGRSGEQDQVPLYLGLLIECGDINMIELLLLTASTFHQAKLLQSTFLRPPYPLTGVMQKTRDENAKDGDMSVFRNLYGVGSEKR